jgi:hypothetical protein
VLLQTKKKNQILNTTNRKTQTNVITACQTSLNLSSVPALCIFFIPSLVLPNNLLRPFSPLLVSMTAKSIVAVFFVLVDLVVPNVFSASVSAASSLEVGE